LVEHVVVAESAGPPLHVHPSHAEGFYVLAGELTFQVGDEMRTARAGAIFFLPALELRTRSPTSVTTTRAC
jgi:quercetin dioxygenase-like cupin family protein